MSEHDGAASLVRSDALLAIPFTQFLMPDGRQKPISIKRPKDVVDKALSIIAAGGRFTAEVLGTGAVSLALELEGDDYDLELLDNGPGVPDAVDALVERVHESLIANASVSIPGGEPGYDPREC